MQVDRQALTFARAPRTRIGCALAALVLLVLPGGWARASAQKPGQQAYGSPDEAVAALVAAVRANDRAAFTAVVGDALDQLASGDEVQDNLTLMTFASRLLAAVDVVTTDATTAVLYTGAQHVLFRIPIRKGGRGWYFDVDAGKKQLLDARIGQNESRAVELLRLFVKAQQSYYSEDRDGDGVLEYAQRLRSTPGTRDGLFWPNNSLAAESPLGPLMSLAKSQGYVERGARPHAFQGYYFRVLVRQGPNAPGDRKEYVLANGNMTEGFACVAYPARWGASGIMTFMIGPDGRVLEKNLGKSTGLYASATSEFNPDATWAEVKR